MQTTTRLLTAETHPLYSRKCQACNGTIDAGAKHWAINAGQDGYEHWHCQPSPHDHATRDAAQRADEAELPSPCLRCSVYGTYSHTPDQCPDPDGFARTSAPTLAQRSALGTPEADAARWLANRGLPPMAGGSEDLDTHAVRELDLYAENTSELYPQFRAIIANPQRRISTGTYDASEAPKLWRYWYDAAAKRYQTDVCPMRFTPAVRQAAAEQRAIDEYAKITAGEYDPAPGRILAP